VGEPGVRATARQRNVLLEAGLALASELSLRVVLQRLVELAVEVTGAQYGALGVLAPEGFIEEFITTGVSLEVREAIGHTPVGRGILGLLIENAQTLRLHDIGEHPRSVGFPPNHPPMHTFLGAPVTARGRIFGNLYLTEKRDGDDFTEEDEAALEILATQAGVAIENARLYEEARRSEGRLEAIRDITGRILEGAETQQVLQLIADRARELAGVSLATVATPDEDGDWLEVGVASGPLAGEVLGTRFPTEGSISGDVIRTGKAVVLEDSAADERVAQPFIRSGAVGPAMFVPLGSEDSILGTLTVANDPGTPAFTEDDVRAVEMFAGQAAVAMRYGAARQELQRLAVLEDRERIAKELHDGVIQSLFAVGMGLQGAAQLTSDPVVGERIESTVTEIDRVIRDLRNYIFGLRPGILADRQLGTALKRLADEFAERTGIVTIAQIDPDVAQQVTHRAVDLVQLAREALSNVGRHSGASTCRVSLRREGDEAVLEIDDDGLGFDPAAVRTGQGVPNLRARAETLGGRLDISSVADDGVTVRARFPL
jgi:signal transduction histidine kinase